MSNRGAFVPSDYGSFRFVGIEVDEASGAIDFSYELAGADAATLPFAERIMLALPDDGRNAEWTAARDILPLLGAVLGLSYYKAAAPPRYEIAVDGLTDAGAIFLREALRHGLAEFAYRAGLPALLETEVVVTGARGEARASADLPVERLHRPLAPVGGGKDSVVTVESLRLAGLDVTQFSVKPNAIMRRVAEAAELPFIAADRRIDPALLELNGRGALNGHVPVTAMNSLIAVAQARLLSLGPVVMSNENSAAEPTMVWNGEPVNHQWSKSLDAELLLAAAIEAQTGERGGYFSLLRPFTELKIAGKFAATDRYDHAIVSCNRAFRLSGAEPGWCGECAKCQFVFLVLSPFMSRERLVGIIGTDMFETPALVDGFASLLGIDAHKPFECVGEEAESTVAMSLAARSAEWGQSAVVRAMVERAPELLDGDPALEASLFSDREAPTIPAIYSSARNVLGARS
ncbi:hypothetical protein OH146_12380 [Salinibacterium sp. SYSU T00001]|uniref:hypothetical protein n=1 Tax=Homoserinimonas sedimenticola TaxID=2986805 RepID=UPI002236AB3D|nr:hypothetical protein [Salinibacterium sedimenticola]MCW4386571.1 hypothetical protein [Salinibacterium sedimenticola]